MKNINILPHSLQQHAYNPEKWSNRYGKPCPVCNQKIRLSKSISVCDCPLFSHRQCFLISFSKQNCDGKVVICQQCNHQIQLLYETEYNFKPKLSIPLILVASILGIIALIMLTQANKYLDQKRVQVQTFLLSYITVLSSFCISIMLMLFRRERVLIYVKSTQKSMKISMLDEIQNENNIRSSQISGVTQQAQKVLKNNSRNS